MLGMTVDARAGETLSANRLNGCFQSRLRSLYNPCPQEGPETRLGLNMGGL